ncbi:NAD(P)-binding protein [Mycena venus]|uniref:NAD(P)-binding protein n=1 Tax=Mycena venus TaxID=2733690 RepID=A0A8H6XXH4_9AGAR|nr:NAD(P)-binding protein [Mycena venus]
MTILLTGGTGKTASPLSKLLLQAKQPVVLATRSGKVPAPFSGVRFDWLDSSTYNIPFDAYSDIDRIYIVAPPVMDMFPPMKAFIDYAVERGVKRFVLLSAGVLEIGGPSMGKAHEYLDSLKVEYCALRPSWFIENFTTQYADLIKTRNEIVSATGDGLLGYVSTEDIADVAFKALVEEKIDNNNPIIVGPELVSYDQIADMLTEILGRKITHTKLTEAEFKKVLIGRGMPEDYAQMMTILDSVHVARGGEEQLFRRADVVGKRTLRAFLEARPVTVCP